MLSGKYKRFIANDIDARLPVFFRDCAFGKYTVENHPEWISREEFNARKNDDAYIALVWSFGNNGKDYLYGADIEDMKHAYHRAVYFNEIEALEPFGYKLSRSEKKSVYERYLDYQRQLKKQIEINQYECVTRHNTIERLQSLQSLQGLQSLQRLQSLQSLQGYGLDYQDIPIPEGALIYCDIPYVGTNCGKYGGFNHERFYRWAREQDNIFISEYRMPEDFIPYAHREKQVLSAASGNDHTADEVIYTNERTYKRLSETERARSQMNFTKQMTMFDF